MGPPENLCRFRKGPGRRGAAGRLRCTGGKGGQPSNGMNRPSEGGGALTLIARFACGIRAHIHLHIHLHIHIHIHVHIHFYRFVGRNLCLRRSGLWAGTYACAGQVCGQKLMLAPVRFVGRNLCVCRSGSWAETYACAGQVRGQKLPPNHTPKSGHKSGPQKGPEKWSQKLPKKWSQKGSQKVPRNGIISGPE